MSEVTTISLKDLAFELNVSQQKLKEISVELFERPLREFDLEQRQKVQNALTVSGINQPKEILSLVQAVENNVSSEIAPQQNPVSAITENLTQLYEQPAKIARIKEILGNSTITKNIAYWQQLSLIRIKKALAEQEKMLVAFRVASNDQVNQTFEDMGADIRNQFQIVRKDWFTAMTGDLTQELQVLSTMEVDLTQSTSKYEVELRKAVDELMTLG